MAFGVTRDPVSGAVRANRAATGNPRYGLNRSATATTGPVDKTGYIERDRKRAARRGAVETIGARYGTAAATVR